MSSDAVQLVREWIRRWQTGEPLDDLVSADYRGSGEPTPFREVQGRTADERRASIQSDVRVSFRDVIEGIDGRVMFEAVWAHDGGDGAAGSAGLFWGVCEVRDGRIHAVAYHRDQAAARTAAGLT